jgi:protein involved in polysaccharide export with SLBB domain
MFRFFLLLTVGFSFAQSPTENAILKEAERRNIVTVDQALKTLKENGISESQARILAREKGVSFDEFLFTNFKKTTSVDKSIISVDPDNTVLVPSNTDFIQDSIPALVEPISKSDPIYFGYSIFDRNPFLEKEYLLGNIDEGYLVSPGDKLRLIVFGNNSLEFEAVVDRNGNINIPNYGIFFAAGNSFKTLKERLNIFLGKYFSGLLTTPQNTFLDVSLTQLTPTKVVVVGQVNAPGPHILTTQANPLAALYAAGGVKTSGSLREVRVYRQNKLIRVIDLYDYIVSGNLPTDIKLTNNDLLFVPPKISSVLLKGEVKKEAYYELKSGESLSDLIDFSGGFSVSAALDRVNILRIDPSMDISDNSDKKLLTIDFNSIKNSREKFELFDGDQIEILSLIDRVANNVSIQGNVYNPGTYSIEKYKDLKSLIVGAARGVKEDTYFDKVDVKGIKLPNGEQTFATYNLTDILSGSIQASLNERDQVIVYSQQKVMGTPLVYISGYGIENSFSELENTSTGIENAIVKTWRENLSLYDLIFENTSFESLTFRKNLYNLRVDLKSYDYDSRSYATTAYDLTDLSNLKEITLKPFDRVVLFNKNVIEKNDLSVSVSGYVNAPGSFELEKDMYVEDAILLSGGFSDLADQSVVYVNREEFDPNTDITSIKFTVSIDKEYIMGLKDKPSEGLVLGSNDIISVRKDIAFDTQQTIKVSGEVNYPRTVVAESKNVSLKYLIDEVGGLTRNALVENSYVIRDQKTLVLDIANLNMKKAIFKDGDEIIIAKNFGSVTTEGAVENPSIFNWEKGKRAKYFISNSGGKLNKIGGKAFVVLNNGNTKRVGFLKNPRVYPDSKVIINYKPKKERKEGEFLNTTTTILGTVTGALTTILLLERL